MHFRDQPIARKALTLGIVPTVCALVLVTAMFAGATVSILRSHLAHDAEALSAFVADNMSAPVGFNDPETAAALLRGLQATDSLDKACVYDASGQLFASFARQGFVCASTDVNPVPGPSALTNQRDIAVGRRRVGSLQLDTNERALYASVRALAGVAGGTLVIALLIAWTLSLRMQRAVSGPIVALADVADRITASRDYSVRADTATNDEVGRLAQAFNVMVAQVQNQNKVKDEFLATLSHELRTPLNAILGWLQVIQHTNPDASSLERAVASLERNAKAQQRVVEDLLDISRVVTGKLQMVNEVVDLRAVVTGAVDLVATNATRKRVHLTSELPPQPCLVSGDLGRLQQAVSNLIGNGIKFTPADGAVHVRITHSGSTYAIVVADNGMGIDPAFLPHVFDRFQQADSSATRAHGGLGLGLAIVKEIVNLHGGDVTGFSAGRGQGATFTITLPELVSYAAPFAAATGSAEQSTVAAVVDEVASGRSVEGAP